MGYKQRVAAEIQASGRRPEDRLALWEAILRSFESTGAEGVQDDLAKRMGHIRRRFDALLVKLEDML